MDSLPPTTHFDDDVKSLYQPEKVEIASLFISLLCISVMSLLFGRKTAGTRIGSINYARGLVIILYFLSWLFSVVAAMLVQTNNRNQISCTLSILVCIVLYATSKVVIYLFLIERVYVVTALGVTRWNSRMYKFNLALISPYLGIFVLAVYFRVAEIQSEDGHCMIGLKSVVSIPLIIYDTFICSWLTGLFVRALLSSTSLLQGPTKSRLRDVARRTFIGSVFALILSSANVASLVYFDGYQRGLYCLASCTLDVTLNAIVIHWVTSRTKESRSDRYRGGGGGNSWDRPAGGIHPHGGNNGNGNQQYAMQGRDNTVDPLESHISVSIESYVEDYHRLQQSSKLPHQTSAYSHVVE
ncbi:hypothetical protein EC957_003229 [Mortierella hygrophila]|uniref:Transmembrane protein n=1 Tax=Mortierella hygrophila TaxID=979708 RepID=A0A9P6F454_9FUNG|nr:hypothetical protein EC957_003229 [Mortierella hygrophila]